MMGLILRNAKNFSYRDGSSCIFDRCHKDTDRYDPRIAPTRATVGLVAELPRRTAGWGLRNPRDGSLRCGGLL